jgi:outer membrane protein assembly factor BamB
MSALPTSALLTGIKGQVVALDKSTGHELWRTRLKGSDFVHVIADGKLVFASTAGEVFCLDGSTGAILWNNPMKGLGHGLVSLLVANGEGGNALLAEESRRARARQAAAGAT